MIIFIYILSLCAAIGITILLAKPLKFIFKVLANSVLGCVLILVVNSLTTAVNIGINSLTAAVCGFLGLPGVMLLVLFELFV